MLLWGGGGVDISADKPDIDAEIKLRPRSIGGQDRQAGCDCQGQTGSITQRQALARSFSPKAPSDKGLSTVEVGSYALDILDRYRRNALR
jgi:hypothetical protein